MAADLDGPIWVVKSQIHAGGRGAGRFKGGDPDHGGVRLAKSVDEVVAHTDAMLGNVLVTKQTGPDGKEVGRVYVEEGCDIARELYLSLLVDRATSRVTVMASTEGGMEIEEVAEATPEKIITLAIDPVTGLQGHHARRVAFALGLEGKQVGAAVKFLTAMYKAFTELDTAMLEINPLVVTGDGAVIALDAKMSFEITRFSVTPKSPTCAMRPKRTRPSWRPVRVEWWSSWTARSAAWSTAPAWRWRQWTLSNCSAGHRPIPRCRRRRDQGAGDRGL